MRYLLPIICGLLAFFGLYPAASAQVSRIEYYLDHDPGYGAAVSVPFTPSTANATTIVSVDPSTLSSGIHRFVVRAQDVSGAWSLQESKLFFVPFQTTGISTSNLSPINKIEYYLDHDPGLGAAISIPFTPGTDVSQLVIPIDPTVLSSGIHRFVVRARDASGAWSLQESSVFFVPFQTSGIAASILSPINKIEYYLDHDPGLGNAISVPFTPGTDASQLLVSIDPSLLSSGLHRFVVRAQDMNGAWSLQESKMFFVPFVTSGNNATALPALSRVEYYVDTDPGYGNGIIVPFTPGSNASNLIISLNPADYAVGPHKVVVRAQDASGAWSLNNLDTFRVFANAVSTNPLPLTGFNADVIAEMPADAVASTNNDVDNYGNVWMSESYNPLGTSWLPDNGFVSDFYQPGVDFQLQPYNQNNTLKLGYWQTDSLMLSTPVAADSFYLLGTSSWWNSFTAKMVFVDSSEYIFNGLTMGNWYDPSYQGAAAVSGLGWCYKWSNAIYNHPTETRMYSTKLVVPPSKQGLPLHHIVFQNQTWGNLHLLALSSVGSCAGILNPGATVASAPAICPGASVTLSLQNPIQSSGVSYQWQSADDSAFSQNVQTLGVNATQSAQPSHATYYRCQVSCAGGSQVYSVPMLIDILPVPADPIAADTILACSDSVWVEANAGLATYSWNTGASTMGIFAHQSAYYTVQVSNAVGCIRKDSVLISSPKVSGFPTDTAICYGQSVVLGAAPTSSVGVWKQVIGYWPLHGNAQDISGHGYHGVLNNFNTIANANYLHFDGWDDHVEVQVPKPASCTFSAWTRMNGENPAGRMLFNAGPNGMGPDLYLGCGSFLWNTWDGCSNAFSGGIPSNITDSSFHHIVVVNDANANTSIYFDGVLVGTAAYRSASYTNELRIGVPSFWYGSYDWNGDVSDFGLFNGALTATEVQSLYQAGRLSPFDPSASVANLQWSTFDSTVFIQVSPTQNTDYYCSLSDGISTCIDTISVIVNPLPQNPILQDTLFACADSLHIQAQTGFDHYVWSTGDTLPDLFAHTSGFYKLQVSNTFGCEQTDSVWVSVFRANIHQPDTAVCSGSSILLQAENPLAYYASYPKTAEYVADEYYDYDDFEGGPNSNDDWTERNGIDPQVVNNTSFMGTNSLYFSDGWGRNFEFNTTETGQPSYGYYSADYPYMSMAYKIPSSSHTSMLVHINGIGWRSIAFTQGEQLYCYSKVGSWNTSDAIATDNQWHFKTINLHEQLQQSLGAGNYKIEAVIFHDACGTYGVSGEMWIDQFMITKHLPSLYPISYTWSNTDTTSSIFVTPNQSTTYWLEMSDELQTCSDSVSVSVLTGLPSNFFAQDTLVACGDSLQLAVPAGMGNYVWSNGDTLFQTMVHHSGWYSVLVSNGSGCQQIDSVFVLLMPNQIHFSNDSICQGESITLSAGVPTSLAGYYGPYTYNGHTYFVSQLSLTWTDANAQAMLLGGHLATVSSAGENAFLTTTALSVGHGAMWLGASDANIEGVWEQVNGEPWVYSNWNWGEPNNSGNEDYLELVTQYGGVWNDLSTYVTIPYAVEFDWQASPIAPLWSTGDSSVSITLQPNSSTLYWVSSTYGANTCTDTLMVYVSPIPSVQVSASAQMVCAGDSVILNASGADTYNWDGGQIGSSLVMLPLANTTYTVVGSNALGCTNTATYSVDVHLTSSSLTQATACGSYTWNGLTYDSTNCQGGIQAFDGSNHYYRYATIYDWDCCLFSAGVMEGPAYPVDGHVKVEYNCNGSGIVVESTGGYAGSYPVGSAYGNYFGYNANPTFMSLGSNASCCNASGNQIYVELSAERISPPHILHFTNAEGCDSAASLQLTFENSAIYFADNDNDGYGDINQSVVLCSPPSGYVLIAGDCNDNDSSEHPNQAWYTDHDHDQYGTGNYVVQCSRPSDAYLLSELISPQGDCNDYDASIRPGAQYFVLSNTTNFPNVLVNPQSGDATTTFQFEVTYVDSNNALPAPGFPRIILDYEGNGYYGNINDRTLVMQPYDVNDGNTVDGKKYIATTTNLAYGLNYEVLVQNNNGGCITQAGPYLYPDVLQKPDLEIFANDITFSVPNPPISSQLTVSAVVHNESNQVAQNFWVHLRNQYDTSVVYPDVFVNAVAPYGSTTVSWQITTPSLPAWCPMEVSVDYTQLIQETNELDNAAIRPFVNGNFNLPGGIHVYPNVSPAVQYASPGAVVNITGFAAYYGTAVPLADSSVAGATVTFTIVETGATYSSYTNSFGNFSVPIVPPPILGVYHVVGSVTDFTLTGNFTDSFTLIPNCNLSDLTLGGNQYSTIVAGSTISSTMHIANYGLTSSQSVWLDMGNTGGSPLLSGASVPALAPGASYDVPYNVTFSTPGYYTICGYVDPSNSEPECAEYNNQACHYVTVLPAQPDIVPYGGPSGFSWICATNGVSFAVGNQGATPTGPFDCEVEIWHNGILMSTQTHTVSNIDGVLSGNNSYSFSVPFTPVLSGQYSFHVRADLPQNAVLETNESNNEAIYTIDLAVCKPDLVAGSCEEFNVESPNTNYTPGSNITLKGRIYNSGNLAYVGSLQLHWILSGGSTYNSSISVNLAPGASVPVSYVVTAPIPATQDLTLSIDPNNTIDELNETNNSITNAMCWDFSLADLCGYNFWSTTVQQYSTMYLSIGVVNPDLYDADTLRVKFQVSGPGISGTLDLGNAYVYNIGQNCFCPVAATLPASFAFQQTGVYTFTMTVDPNNQYTECDETNNVLVRQITVTDLPDMRVLSQYIAPSLLNPAVNQPIGLNVTYENIGRSNVNDQMSLQILVDNNLHQTINGLSGLITGIDTTIAISNPIASNLVGIHVIRAIIDAGNQVNESDEYNNEATRSFIVGDAANLYFSSFHTLSPNPALGTTVNISSKIGNGGDLACEADVKFYYVNNNLDTIYIGTEHVNVPAHDSVNATESWVVADAQTTLIGKIVNATQLEYTYDDNNSSYPIGQMLVVCSSVPACGPSMFGSVTANVVGGEPPYYMLWNTGWVGDTLIDSTGTYTVVVTDATGQSVTATAQIPVCPQALLHTRFFIEGYYVNNGVMTPAMYNQGLPVSNSFVDSVVVELHENGNGYGLVESAHGLLHTDGTVDAYFSSAVNGNSYYVAIRHRNSVCTWSSNPVLITTNSNYDFSTSASQAYGNNMKAMDTGYFALYSGDINQDENVDLLDLSQIETDIVNFEDGYMASDLNGDGNVDLLDSPILEENRSNFIYSLHP